VLALVGVAGVPALGGGVLLVPLATGLLQADTFARAGLLPTAAFGMLVAVVGGLALLATAVIVAVRRLSSPHFRQEARARAAFSLWQATRLWVPAATVVLAGLLSPFLLDDLAAALSTTLPSASGELPFADGGAP
jgi:hypothetical protein